MFADGGLGSHGFTNVENFHADEEDEELDDIIRPASYIPLPKGTLRQARIYIYNFISI